MTKLKLNPIDVLNLRFASRIYDKEFISAFVNQLDLSSADDICEKAKSICTWYEEIVINHAYFLKNFLDDHLSNSDDQQLLIFLSAGKSPLSLEITKKNSDKIFRVIELDNDGMYEKKEIYDRYYPGLSPKIKCLNADIKTGSLLSTINLVLEEYSEELPCVVILEKVIHYLKPEELQHIVSSFKSSGRKNTFVVEYILPEELMSPECRSMVEKLFELVNSHCGMTEINHYSESQVAGMFSSFGGELLLHQNMMEIELQRMGSNKYFQKHEDGWLECAAWKI
ncbi:MAG: hypothetical protein V1720_03710 [bacterium]